MKYCTTKWELLQRCKGGSTYVTQIPHQPKERKNLIIISIDAGKAFDVRH